MGRGKRWSTSDIDYLDNNWGRLTLSYISIKLKRTQKAVVLKAKRLKLGASTKADEYLTANQVSVLLNIDIHTVLRWVEKHNLRAVKKIMLYKRKFVLIKHCDLLRWLKNNQEKFNSRKIDSYNFGYMPLWLKLKRKEDRKLPKRRFKKWTDSEIQRIIELYKNMKYKEIAKIMDRSYSSIEHKLYRLKYKKGSVLLFQTGEEMRYIVITRWWNGKDWDMTKKEIDTKDKVIGAVKLLLKETNPYQISITDTSREQ